MKNLYKQKRQQGFTIIEVLIVLAIAALILLIVFLAVPALQRNSRNNAIKNDAANMLAAVNDYVSNNSGQLPTAIGGCGTGTVTFSGGAGTVSSEAKTQGSTACSLVTAGAPTWNASAGNITIGENYKCSGQTAVNASPRAIVALFRIENTGAGGTAQQCLES